MTQNLFGSNPLKRFTAHFTVNSREEISEVYALALQGRQKLRELERRYRTHGAIASLGNSLIDLMSFMTEDFDFNSAIDHECELAGNSGVFLISEKSSLSDSISAIPIDEPCATDAEVREQGQLQSSIEDIWLNSLNRRRNND
jgi:hypothetical protein